MIFQARPRISAGNGPGAVAEGKDTPEHFQCLAHGLGAGKRPEIARAVRLQPPGDVHPGPFLLEVYFEVGKGLVILQPDVVAGVVTFDEVEL